MSLFLTRTIIIVIAVIFVICGLLHLLVKYLIKKKRLLSSSNSHYPSSRFQESGVNDAFETQLQQLFNLHDSGLDQDFIDALPVFCYKELMGLKEPFDCAVCLCEFTQKDSLRLLPLCSHAFHIYCIDTWLLSNSTCPLCRGSVFAPGFCVDYPVFEFDGSREGNDVDDGQGYFGHFVQSEGSIGHEKRVYPVRLGSFRALNVGKGEEKEAGETSDSNFDDGQGHFGHFKHSNGSIGNEKMMNPVRLGSFRAMDVGKRGETEAGETSNSNFDDGQGHFGHFKHSNGSIGNEKTRNPVRLGSFSVMNVGKRGETEAEETSNSNFDDGQGHFGHFKHSDGSISNEKTMNPVRLGSFRALNVGKGEDKEAGETSDCNFDDGQGHFGHWKHSNGSISNKKTMNPVRLGSFRAISVEKRGETEAGETSNSTFDDGDDRQGHFGHFKHYDGSTSNEKRVYSQGHSGHFKQSEDSIGNEKTVFDQGHFGHFKQFEGNIGNEKRVYQVKLGKFRATNVEKGKEDEARETSNSNVDARRCYSMGTYEYVVANSELRVEFVPSKSSRGSFGNKDKVDSSNDGGNIGKKISNKSKGESFSVSKIWLWSKKDHHHQKSQLFSGTHMVSSSVNIHS